MRLIARNSNHTTNSTRSTLQTASTICTYNTHTHTEPHSPSNAIQQPPARPHRNQPDRTLQVIQWNCHSDTIHRLLSESRSSLSSVRGLHQRVRSGKKLTRSETAPSPTATAPNSNDLTAATQQVTKKKQPLLPILSSQHSTARQQRSMRCTVGM